MTKFVATKITKFGDLVTKFDQTPNLAKTTPNRIWPNHQIWRFDHKFGDLSQAYPEGWYNDEPNQTECKKCPEGEYQTYDGSGCTKEKIIFSIPTFNKVNRNWNSKEELGE